MSPAMHTRSKREAGMARHDHTTAQLLLEAALAFAKRGKRLAEEGSSKIFEARYVLAHKERANDNT